MMFWVQYQRLIVMCPSEWLDLWLNGAPFVFEKPGSNVGKVVTCVVLSHPPCHYITTSDTRGRRSVHLHINLYTDDLTRISLSWLWSKGSIQPAKRWEIFQNPQLPFFLFKRDHRFETTFGSWVQLFWKTKFFKIRRWRWGNWGWGGGWSGLRLAHRVTATQLVVLNLGRVDVSEGLFRNAKHNLQKTLNYIASPIKASWTATWSWYHVTLLAK